MDLALARVAAAAARGATAIASTRGSCRRCGTSAASPRRRCSRDPTQNERPVTVLGKGTRLIGGTIKTDADARRCRPGAASTASSRRVGATTCRRGSGASACRSSGLPYAADPAVTRHLARFLSRQAAERPRRRRAIRRGPSGLACPTHVLFNGGVMKAAALRARVVEVLNGWLQAEGLRAARCRRTSSTRPDLDHAVARGAAYYGLARARPRRPHPQRRPAQLLHRHRERDAGGARACRRRSRRCASCRSAWRRARARRSRTASSAWSSASRRSSGSSARPSARRIRSAR